MAKLFCKKGDMAVIVKSDAGNEGKIVTCLELFYQDYVMNGVFVKNVPSWRIDRDIPGSDGSSIDYCIDSWMRPLRDSDGVDEMVVIAGKPVTEKEFINY